jgi:uncharacterized membrane protein HdeD (DUF308 family)
MTADLKRSPWLTIEGGVLIILGIAALLLPVAAGITLSLVIGLILIASGLVGAIAASTGHAHAHRGLGLASAIVALAVGFLLIFFPLAGPVGLTILLGAYLFVDGVLLIGMAMDHRKRGSARWGWLLASGIVDLVLAAILLLLSGAGSAALIGIVVGVDLILAGIALLLVHRANMRDAGEPPVVSPSV